MVKPVEFWFEFASTYSYLAAARVEDACAEAGVPLVWRSFLLGPVFGAQGMTDSPFNMFPVKGAYMWVDMARCCADLGLPFVKPSSFPRGSLLAARIAAAHCDAPWVGTFVRAVYHANFADDRNIADDGVIADILGEIGQDRAAVLAAATATEGKARLRAATEEAMERGLFGAPSFIVDGAVFWGNDRLEQALRHARTA
ncbi:2-hydroxychromene-2-carboxylate isomerase [Tateyamaria omphalii]|uniref:2-hydroxychromene-2-carboxylate isomerase n=1 Tax=Tateyamaria omphalii TaxID=299262 RepID=UPI001C9925F8|nr:2-hydroxychromene-2-carboxylate isomerase [Tateyamaria omphalii]MBY5933891.1 2-hydroxychromene-2-carboxylate isomerase [Tateyamaria omphalii]